MKHLAHWMIGAAGLLAVAAHAADGFNPDDWQHHQKTVLDTTAEGVEIGQPVTQFPLALRLHTGNFAFTEAKADGSDLRVTGSDGKTPLHFHIEKFDATNELAVVWVQQPALAPKAKTDSVTLHWGNEKATATGDAKATYDPAQRVVLHFSDNGPVRDATGANNPTDFTGKTVAGPLGDAIALDGNSALTIPASPALKLVAGSGMTFSAWIKPTASTSGTLYEQAENGKGVALALKGGKLLARVNGKEIASQATILADTWQHIAFTIAGNKLAFYLDGAPAGTAEAAVDDIGGNVVIGTGLQSEIDEVTLAATARSADYIKATFGSQQPDSLMFSSDKGGESGGESYVGILLNALTVDGWVVIGILAVMGVISFGVMIGKAIYLSRTSRANGIFLDTFRDNARKLLRPDSAEVKQAHADTGNRHSTIYRLYKIGIHEMHRRFEVLKEQGKAPILSGASLDSIRAAMDAGLVRENQRLNSQIVLLTIAISGGPFLGLLGTVVGVMITFAAIAAAGDVNVNSIAPGIAAALVATVAGLAVAIPALFGYNWLSSQIKNVSADTQVFADEFLTQSAELYSA